MLGNGFLQREICGSISGQIIPHPSRHMNMASKLRRGLPGSGRRRHKLEHQVGDLGAHCTGFGKDTSYTPRSQQTSADGRMRQSSVAPPTCRLSAAVGNGRGVSQRSVALHFMRIDLADQSEIDSIDTYSNYRPQSTDQLVFLNISCYLRPESPVPAHCVSRENAVSV